MLFRKKYFLWVLSIGVVLLMLVGCTDGSNMECEPTEDTSINTNLENLTDDQKTYLQKLCKVWGYVKYYHPDVVAGKVDWDAQLLKVIPNVLDAANDECVNEVLAEWIGSLGALETVEDDAPSKWEYASECKLEPTVGWIHDENYLGKELKEKLEQLQHLYLLDRTKAYVSFRGCFSDFSNEECYPNMDFADKELKLLGLFRFWNAVEYYYPYKDIIYENWDNTLLEFIPKFLEGEDKTSYVLDIAELTTKIHDPHAWVGDSEHTFIKYFGNYIVPIRFTVAEEQVVITKVVNVSPEKYDLKPGDVVKEFDGKEIQNAIEEKLEYVSVSSPEKFVYCLQNYLFRTGKEQVEIIVERDGELITQNVVALDKLYLPYETLPSHELLDGNVGLVNPGFLEKDEIISIMDEFWDTKGIIIDLRQYPSDFIVYSLAEFLISNPKKFCMMSMADQVEPGSFTIGAILESGSFKTEDERYQGKVAILMNESSMSQSEFTIMSLRNAPRAKVIGSYSIGADGDIVEIPLPGNITTVMTGLGIYTPDGGQTQRVGLSPDMYLTPTIEGITQGRDELMEAAIDYVLEED